MTNETLSMFDALGLDADSFEWTDLSICRGQDTTKFYEGYESSTRTAMLVDDMCLSCPVRNQCLQAGVDNNEWGVWGGIFLVSGKADMAKNSHKTKEVWQKIRDGISE